MAADAYEVLRLHEKREIAGTCTPTTGTITIASATVSLFDSVGAIAGGVSGASATGFTAGASAAPSAWFLLRPSVLGIAAGRYQLSFLITDSSGFVYEPTIGIRVLPDY